MKFTFINSANDKVILLYTTYVVSIIGVAVDQLSTRIGLSNPKIFEMNPIAAQMIDKGIWLYVDITAALFTILSSQIVMKFWSFKYKQLISFFPLTFGILKLFTGIANIFFIIF